MSKEKEATSKLEKKIGYLSSLVRMIGAASNRWLFLFISFALLVTFYFLAPHIVGASLVQRAGTVITALGLLLSIKHTFLLPNSTTKSALETTESEQGGFIPKYDGYTYCTANLENTNDRLADEVTGFFLIVFGTFVSAFGDMLPFYKLVPVSLCVG